MMDRRSEFDQLDGEKLRAKLIGIAYRMLGSAADAEDAVQDAFLKCHQTGGVENREAWLVTATTRQCIDRLRRSKRRKEYVGPWLPEPTPATWEGALVDRTELAESLSMAFLVMLESLTPTERAAYLLREAFDYEFNDIADVLGKSPANARQLVTRARRRLGRKERRFSPDARQAESLAMRFFAACQSGNIDEIKSMLAGDATLYSDGGGKVFAARRPLTDSGQIAKLLSVVFRKLQLLGTSSISTVNGQPGAVFRVNGQTMEVVTLASDGKAVQAVYVVLNPDKLATWNE